jgi:hypothetical protein
LSTHIAPKEWVKTFGGVSSYGQSLSVLARSNSSSVVVVSAPSSIDFGEGPLLSAGSQDLFFASFNPEGDLDWAARTGTAQNELLWNATLDASGAILFLGSGDSALDFGAVKLPAASGPGQPFWGRIDAEGDASAAARVGAPGSAARGAAFGSTGVTYSIYQTQPNLSPSETEVIALDMNGQQTASISFSYSTLSGLAGTPDGGLAVTGAAPYGVKLGEHKVDGGNFIAKLDAKGQLTALTQFGSSGYAESRAPQVTADGSIIVTGSYYGVLTVNGKDALAESGDQGGAFLIKLKPTGELNYAIHLPGALGGYSSAFAVCPDGRMAVLASHGYADGGTGSFLLTLEADGNASNSRDISGDFSQVSAVCDAHGFVHMTGIYYGTLSLLDESFTAPPYDPLYPQQGSGYFAAMLKL